MIRPHPPRFLMKRRKTVSVTPAMGARTVAGEILTFPIFRVAGKAGARVGTGVSPVRPDTAFGLSQNFCTDCILRPFDPCPGVRQFERIEADMVQKLREILLTRYIGSIVVALLCWQPV